MTFRAVVAEPVRCIELERTGAPEAYLTENISYFPSLGDRSGKLTEACSRITCRYGICTRHFSGRKPLPENTHAREIGVPPDAGAFVEVEERITVVLMSVSTSVRPFRWRTSCATYRREVSDQTSLTAPGRAIKGEAKPRYQFAPKKKKHHKKGGREFQKKPLKTAKTTEDGQSAQGGGGGGGGRGEEEMERRRRRRRGEWRKTNLRRRPQQIRHPSPSRVMIHLAKGQASHPPL